MESADNHHPSDDAGTRMNTEPSIQGEDITSEDIIASKPTDNSFSEPTEHPSKTEQAAKTDSNLNPTDILPNKQSLGVEQHHQSSEDRFDSKTKHQNGPKQKEDYQLDDFAAKPAETSPEPHEPPDQVQKEFSDPKAGPPHEAVEPPSKGDDNQHTAQPATNDVHDAEHMTKPPQTIARLRHWHSMVSPTHSVVEEEITPKEWERRAKPLRKSAYSSWVRLSKLIERYEETFINRWRNGGAKRRKDLILQHWPDMAPLRRPDLQAFMSRKPTDEPLPDPSDESFKHSSAQQIRQAVLWPYMDIEHLGSKWLYFVQLLHSRARESMGYFALQDMPPSRQDFLGLFIRFKTVSSHYMVIAENVFGFAQLENKSYGQLVSIEDDETSSWAIADKYIMHPGLGLVLLEIQERLYKFLLDVCMAIIHDVSEALLESNVGIKPDPGLISTATAASQQAWTADERDEAPYSGSDAQYYTIDNREAQRRFNQNLIEAKLNEASDHWALLRYDPGYFVETITQWRDHSVEMLLDTKGCASSLSDSDIWLKAVEDCVMTAFQKMLFWDEMLRRMYFLQRGFLQTRSLGGENSAAYPNNGEWIAHAELRRSFLYNYLSYYEDGLVRHLKKLWTFSPRLRPYSRRMLGERLTCESSASSVTLGRGHNENEKTETKVKGTETADDDDSWRYDQDHEYEQLHTNGEPPKKRKPWEYYEWLFSCLYDDKARSVLGTQTLLNELDYLVNSSAEATISPPPEHWMLSDLVNWHISDLATHTEVFDGEFKSPRDSMHHILNSLRENESWLAHEALMFRIRATGAGLGGNMAMKGPFTFQGSPTIWSLGVPIDGRFDYPLDKAVKTEEDQKKLIEATKALHHFWIIFNREVGAQKVCHWIRNHNELVIPDPPEIIRQHIVERQAQLGIPADDVAPKLSSHAGSGRRHSMLQIRLDVDKRALKV